MTAKTDCDIIRMVIRYIKAHEILPPFPLDKVLQLNLDRTQFVQGGVRFNGQVIIQSIDQVTPKSGPFTIIDENEKIIQTISRKTMAGKTENIEEYNITLFPSLVAATNEKQDLDTDGTLLATHKYVLDHVTPGGGYIALDPETRQQARSLLGPISGTNPIINIETLESNTTPFTINTKTESEEKTAGLHSESLTFINKKINYPERLISAILKNNSLEIIDKIDNDYAGYINTGLITTNKFTGIPEAFIRYSNNSATDPRAYALATTLLPDQPMISLYKKDNWIKGFDPASIYLELFKYGPLPETIGDSYLWELFRVAFTNARGVVKPYVQELRIYQNDNYKIRWTLDYCMLDFLSSEEMQPNNTLMFHNTKTGIDAKFVTVTTNDITFENIEDKLTDKDPRPIRFVTRRHTINGNKCITIACQCDDGYEFVIARRYLDNNKNVIKINDEEMKNFVNSNTGKMIMKNREILRKSAPT